MIVNDLQRLRWQILDECLRNTDIEFFMGNVRGDRETENMKSLLAYLNRRLRSCHRSYKCSKRQLQMDVALFERRGGRLEPCFRRGHKRILRLANLNWKNPLLRQAVPLPSAGEGACLPLSALADNGGDEVLMLRLYGQAREQMGTELLSLTTTIDEQMRRTIWAERADVEVVYPDSLRQEMARGLQEMILRYTKAVSPDLVAQGFASLGLSSPAPQPEEKEPAGQPQPEEPQQEAPQPEAPLQEPTAPKPSKHKEGEQLSLFDDMF